MPKDNATRRDAGSLSSSVRTALCVSLALASMNWLGCQHARPIARTDEGVCVQLSQEEWTGFYVLVQVAIAEKAMGDPVHVAATVSAYGAQLKRCWPEKFK